MERVEIFLRKIENKLEYLKNNREEKEITKQQAFSLLQRMTKMIMERKMTVRFRRDEEELIFHRNGEFLFKVQYKIVGYQFPRRSQEVSLNKVLEVKSEIIVKDKYPFSLENFKGHTLRAIIEILTDPETVIEKEGSDGRLVIRDIL